MCACRAAPVTLRRLLALRIVRAGAYTRVVDTNVLYYGDNLDILRTHIPAKSVDPDYLDPPFNSNGTYSAIFADESGRKGDAQIHAFEDSWHWGRRLRRTCRT